MAGVTDDLVVIWSGEHSAYWRPNACGYAADVRDAGIYSRAKAEAILNGCSNDKRLDIRPVPTITPSPGTVAALAASPAETTGSEAVRSSAKRKAWAQEAARISDPDRDMRDGHDCAWPECGCDHDAICRVALARLPEPASQKKERSAS